jgi:hypothetical protein
VKEYAGKRNCLTCERTRRKTELSDLWKNTQEKWTVWLVKEHAGKMNSLTCERTRRNTELSDLWKNTQENWTAWLVKEHAGKLNCLTCERTRRKTELSDNLEFTSTMPEFKHTGFRGGLRKHVFSFLCSCYKFHEKKRSDYKTINNLRFSTLFIYILICVW